MGRMWYEVPNARDLTDHEREQLIDDYINRIARHHRGEMYSCVDCYHGKVCAERELIRWYQAVKSLAD